MAKLELLVDSYSPPSEDPNVPSKEVRKGDLFDPVSADEGQRLIDSGAAADPKEAAKQRKAELEAELASLEARKAAIDDEIKAAKSSDS